VALLNKREHKEAILEFKVANRIANNKKVEAILGLTGALIKTREFDSALNYLQNGININGEKPELIREMAYIYLLKGDIDKAEKQFSKISSKMSNSISYLSQYGYLLNLKGNLAESLNYYSKAIDIDPFNSNLYNNRAIIYLRLNSFSRAFDDLNKALSINSNDTDALYNMGFYHENVDNNIEKAIEFYKRVLIQDANYKSAKERLKIIQNSSHEY
jgi:tetratricopeptide (TPR) repeat protein